jgi:[protein-PII] uridylyltransferase
MRSTGSSPPCPGATWLYVPAQKHRGSHQSVPQSGQPDFIWQITKENGSDMRTVSICGKDKPGFYSKIAGVFFQNNIDIVASQAYSLGDAHILDIFNVSPPKDRLFEKEKWEKAEQDLIRALTDDHYLDKALEKIPETLYLPGQTSRTQPGPDRQ